MLSGGRMQGVYYRSREAQEPVRVFIQSLPAKAQAAIDLHTFRVVLPAVADLATLKDISALAGEVDVKLSSIASSRSRIGLGGRRRGGAFLGRPALWLRGLV